MPVFHEEMIQGSESWKNMRRTHITATDLQILMGISPYVSQYQLWQRKLGIIPEIEVNDAMRRGSELEPLALEAYCKIVGRKMTPAVVTHSNSPWAMCSLDAISQDQLSICEIKCLGRTNHQKAMDGYIDPCHSMQMQWQMFVTDVYECDYFVFSEESNHVMTIKRDQDLIKEMVMKAVEFLDCLKTITPPPFSDLDYEDKSDDAYWESLCSFYSMYDTEEKAAIRGKESIKKQMIAHAHGRNIRGSNSKFTKVVTKGRVNYSELIENLNIHDDIVEQYRGASVESYRITLNKD